MTSLSIRGLRNANGPSCKSKLLSVSILRLLSDKSPLLSELCIRETVICAKQITLESLSTLKNLRSLSFINCEFINKPKTMPDRSWFKRMEHWLPDLNVLRITGTSFIEDYDVMILGKRSKLKKLILTNCTKVGIAMPYLAIAFRFGFEHLEHLDFRGTSLVNSDVMTILQNGKSKELFIGPMGRVKRHRPCLDKSPNLVMADPMREDPPHQQVLVVNMGPNGPSWRQVRDEELEDYGLQWVRQRNEERRRAREELEDDHYFIGENGNLIQQQKPLAAIAEEACQSSAVRKRKAMDEDDDSDEDERPSKRMRVSNEASSSAAAVSSANDLNSAFYRVMEGESSLGCVHELPADFKPDNDLSDQLIPNLISKGHNLHTLHLAGCAITDEGLSDIMDHLPNLRCVNAMYTHVTQPKIDQLRECFKNCIFSDARPIFRTSNECTIFCYS